MCSRICSGYEVDFLDSNLLCFDEFTRQMGSAAQWMNGFGAGGASAKMSGHICMDLPCVLLQSLESPWITSARGSEDNFPGTFDKGNGRWKTPYTNMLYGALGTLSRFVCIRNDRCFTKTGSGQT